MGIIDGKLLLCHGVSDESVDKKISVREYNNRKVYECLNNTFTSNFCSLCLKLPPVYIDDIPRPHKRACYTPYLLPAAISVASENSGGTLATPSGSPRLLLLTYDGPNPNCAMKKYQPYHCRVKRGYCCRKHDKKYATKR